MFLYKGTMEGCTSVTALLETHMLDMDNSDEPIDMDFEEIIKVPSQS